MERRLDFRLANSGALAIKASRAEFGRQTISVRQQILDSLKEELGLDHPFLLQMMKEMVQILVKYPGLTSEVNRVIEELSKHPMPQLIAS